MLELSGDRREIEWICSHPQWHAGQEFVVGPDKAADLQPSIGLMLVAALPVMVLIIAQIVVLVLALTDKELTGLTRLAWAIVIVFAPLIGLIAYMFAKGWPANPGAALSSPNRSRLEILAGPGNSGTNRTSTSGAPHNARPHCYLNHPNANTDRLLIVAAEISAYKSASTVPGFSIASATYRRNPAAVSPSHTL